MTRRPLGFLLTLFLFGCEHKKCRWRNLDSKFFLVINRYYAFKSSSNRSHQKKIMNSIFTWTFRRPPHNKISLIVRRPLRGQPTVSIQIVLEFYVMGGGGGGTTYSSLDISSCARVSLRFKNCKFTNARNYIIVSTSAVYFIEFKILKGIEFKNDCCSKFV